MKIRFEMKAEFSEKDPHIVIQAAQLTDQAREIMEYLEQFSTTNQVAIPIRTDDYLVMVKIEDLILADIDKNLLTIYTVDGIYKTKETLINFQNRINRRINIDHLESLSDSFSGNMMAKMTRGIKSSVSRKYVKSLMNYLGL